MEKLIITTGDLKERYEVIGPVIFQTANRGPMGDSLYSLMDDYQKLFSDSEQSELEKTSLIAMEELQKKARQLGADAIVNIKQDVTINTIDFTYFYMQMYGTAVKLLSVEKTSQLYEDMELEEITLGGTDSQSESIEKDLPKAAGKPDVENNIQEDLKASAADSRAQTPEMPESPAAVMQKAASQAPAGNVKDNEQKTSPDVIKEHEPEALIDVIKDEDSEEPIEVIEEDVSETSVEVMDEDVSETSVEIVEKVTRNTSNETPAAAAAPKQDVKPVQTSQAQAAQTAQTQTAQPVSQAAKPAAQTAKPAAQAAQPQTAKPAAQAAQTQTAKPAAQAAQTQTAKPATQAALPQTAKPATQTARPQTTAKPVAQTAQTQAAKPAAQTTQPQAARPVQAVRPVPATQKTVQKPAGQPAAPAQTAAAANPIQNKPVQTGSSSSFTKRVSLSPGQWICQKCNTINASYVGTCRCGISKSESRRMQG